MTAINQAIDRIVIYYASCSEAPTMLDEAACYWVLSNDLNAGKTGVSKIIYKNDFENWDTIQSWCVAPQVFSLR